MACWVSNLDKKGNRVIFVHFLDVNLVLKGQILRPFSDIWQTDIEREKNIQDKYKNSKETNTISYIKLLCIPPKYYRITFPCFSIYFLFFILHCMHF